MTCDSDGEIDRFVGGRKGKPSLELHPVREGEPYILGIFLTGAYQEILGDLHNLFGDTNAVHIRLTEQGYEITDLVHGDTVTEVLNYVQFHASRPAGDVPPEGGEREGAVAAGGEHVHRGLRGGAGGVYVSGGGSGRGVGGRRRSGGQAVEAQMSIRSGHVIPSEARDLLRASMLAGKIPRFARDHRLVPVRLTV